MAEVAALFQDVPDGCGAKLGNYNTAKFTNLPKAQQQLSIQQQAVDSTQNDLASCMGVTGKVAIANARSDITSYTTEAAATQAMTNTLLSQIQRDVKMNSVLSSVSDIAQDETDKMKEEIETLKAEIRKERRLFLDADPSAPTATAGLYYTKEPDNQLLIAFIICFCIFLGVITALLLLNHIPIKYLTDLAMGERIKIVGVMWVASLLIVYVGFFTFT